MRAGRWRAPALVAAALVIVVGVSIYLNRGVSARGASSGSTTPSTASVAPTTGADPATTSPPAAPAPTLGEANSYFNGGGFGQVAPPAFSNGGDPTGAVGSITWRNWGSSEAIGTGVSDYVGPNQAVASGTQESVRVVAFDLGNCRGRYMYAAVEWYFPQHGQSFDVNRFEDVCIGAYYPPNSGHYVPAPGSAVATGYSMTFSETVGGVSGTLVKNASGAQEAQAVLAFRGSLGVDGTVSATSQGPADAGQAIKGQWSDSGLTLDNCGVLVGGSANPSASCTFVYQGP